MCRRIFNLTKISVMDIQKKKKLIMLIKNYIPQSKNLIATSDSIFDCYNKLGVSSSDSQSYQWSGFGQF